MSTSVKTISGSTTVKKIVRVTYSQVLVSRCGSSKHLISEKLKKKKLSPSCSGEVLGPKIVYAVGLYVRRH